MNEKLKRLLQPKPNGNGSQDQQPSKAAAPHPGGKALPLTARKRVRVATAVLFGHDGNAHFQDPEMNPDFEVDASMFDIQLATTHMRAPKRPLRSTKVGSGDGTTPVDAGLEFANIPNDEYDVSLAGRIAFVPAVVLHFTRQRDAAAQPVIRTDISFVDETRELTTTTLNVNPADNTSLEMLVVFSKEASSNRLFAPALIHNEYQLVGPNDETAVDTMPEILTTTTITTPQTIAFVSGLRASEQLVGIKSYIAAGYTLAVSSVGPGSTYWPLLAEGLRSERILTWSDNSNWPVHNGSQIT